MKTKHLLWALGAVLGLIALGISAWGWSKMGLSALQTSLGFC